MTGIELQLQSLKTEIITLSVEKESLTPEEYGLTVSAQNLALTSVIAKLNEVGLKQVEKKEVEVNGDTTKLISLLLKNGLEVCDQISRNGSKRGDPLSVEDSKITNNQIEQSNEEEKLDFCDVSNRESKCFFTQVPSSESNSNESFLKRTINPFSISISKLLFSPKSANFLLETSKLNSSNIDPCSSVDLVSPIPVISYSPNRELSRREDRLKQIVSELLESEESYIVALKFIRNFYIEPLFIKQHVAIPLPIESMYECLNELIILHTKLLNSLIENQAIKPTDELISIIGKTILDLVIPFFYEEYLKIHNCTLKVIKDNEMFGCKLNNKWTRGWRNYLEATQPANKNMDLSFLSLVQRPITRVAKYRLLLESLIKFSIGMDRISLQNSLDILKIKLQIINRKATTLEEDWLNNKINKLLNFSNINDNYRFSSHFFGKPILIGSITGIFMTRLNKLNLSTYGAILYKSFLILTNIDLRKRQLDISILIDLSKSSLLQNYQDFDGGMYCSDEKSFKILFEYEVYQFELLMIFINRHEYEIWLSHLDILINVVNGPYNMDYSRRKDNLRVKLPQDIAYYDIYVNNQEDFIKSSKNCYFKKLICIENKLKNRNDLSLNIKRCNRMKIESIFTSIWSFQLPKLSESEKKARSFNKFNSQSYVNGISCDTVRLELIKNFFSYCLK